MDGVAACAVEGSATHGLVRIQRRRRRGGDGDGAGGGGAGTVADTVWQYAEQRPGFLSSMRTWSCTVYAKVHDNEEEEDEGSRVVVCHAVRGAKLALTLPFCTSKACGPLRERIIVGNHAGSIVQHWTSGAVREFGVYNAREELRYVLVAPLCSPRKFRIATPTRQQVGKIVSVPACIHREREREMGVESEGDELEQQETQLLQDGADAAASIVVTVSFPEHASADECQCLLAAALFFRFAYFEAPPGWWQ